jgi:hypothetical protein
MMTDLWKTRRTQYSERFVLLAVIALLLSVIPAGAQSFVEYSAKFMCGVALSTNTMVSPGAYFTTINIHNPHDDLFSSQPFTAFLKKAVLSQPEGVTPTRPSPFVQDNLKNDYAEEVDCTIIKRLLGITSTAFIEGYVVIIVPPTGSAAPITNQLDVIGIYTGANKLVVRPANEHIIAPGTT